MAKSQMTLRQRRFVVRALARFSSPSEVAREFAEAFPGDEVPSRQAIWCYDISKAANRDKLSPELEELFWSSRKQFEAEVEHLPIANKAARVASRQRRLDKLQEIIDERAARNASLPGGETGLIAKDYRGKDALREVAVLDTGLLAEMRELEEATARDLGQIITKKDITSDGKALNLFGALSDDELDLELEAAKGREASPAISK